ncbi:MAG: hypothetical protein FWF59_01460 [Turicibacter sp.]|nr:hypothetical protein [Turicibacter sp.]
MKKFFLAFLACCGLLVTTNQLVGFAEINEEAIMVLAPEHTKVFVATNGTSPVFWYSLQNLIDAHPNVNVNNIVTMSEREALDAGRRHSEREPEETERLPLNPAQELEPAPVDPQPITPELPGTGFDASQLAA